MKKTDNNLRSFLSKEECYQIHVHITKNPDDVWYLSLKIDDEGKIVGLSGIFSQRPLVDSDLLIACYGDVESHDGVLVDADLNLHVSDTPHVPINPEEVRKELGDQSALSLTIPGFVSREGQKEMAILVTEAFNGRSSLSIEAGTGTGKSFAYLIPALRYAQNNRRPVVIATATIALQQQLCKKDIPMIQEALHSNLRVVLAKGRNNYLCQQKIAEMGEGLFDEELNDDLRRWAKETKTGDRSELTQEVKESQWNQIASDFDNCVTHRCPHQGTCFVRKARRELLQADLVVTNHHLLLHDLNIRQLQKNHLSPVILPPFFHLIIDESHGLEANIIGVFTEKMSKTIIERLLNRIYIERKKRPGGILARARNYFTADQIAKVREKISAIKKDALLLSGRVSQFLGENDSLLLLPQDISEDWESVTETLENLRISFVELSNVLKSLQGSVESEDKDEDLLHQSRLRGMTRKITSFLRMIRFFKEEWDNRIQVCWVERKSGEAVLHTAPLDVISIIHDLITKSLHTVIYTSATITVNGLFDYWNERMGFTDQKAVSIPSPFHYLDQVLLAVPTDAPMISREKNHQNTYVQYLKDLICEGVKRSKGGALILFTSYYMLHQCFKIMPSIESISFYKQGDMDRGRLLELFREDTHSVLFATASFWEGVDVPGEALRLLIICQLPFVVPSNPIPRARSVALEAEGRNAFMEYMLPEAVIHLRQGFGRLIRSDYDSGAVIIADARIVKKKYASVFLRSLPSCKTCFSPTDELLGELTRFFVNR